MSSLQGKKIQYVYFRDSALLSLASKHVDVGGAD